MSGFEAFATGFFDTLGEGVTKRKDAANDYFAKQMERAGTTGVKALQARRDTLRQVTSVANNLKVQADMPEDVLRGLVNDGPETLNQAYQIYADSVSNGVKVDEDFWRNIYKFSGDVKPDGEPLSAFLEKAVGLYPSNLQSTKAEGGDPFSAFVASAFGYNATERANERLSETEVAEGYSATDLNALSETGFNRPLGDVGVTVDLEEIAMKEAAAREAAKLAEAARNPENKSLSAGEYKNLTDMFNERAEKYRLQTAMDSSVPATPEEIEEAKRKAAVELDEALGSRYDLRAIPDIAPYLPAEESPTLAPQTPVPNQIYMGDMQLEFTGQEDSNGYLFRDEAGDLYTYSAEELGLTASQEMPASDVTDASQRLGADFDAILETAGESDLYINPSLGDVPSLNPGEDPPESFTTKGRLFNFVGVQNMQDKAYAVYEDGTGEELYVLIQEE
jgi:hypothetical protein